MTVSLLMGTVAFSRPSINSNKTYYQESVSVTASLLFSN
jgi:hypothetical protein